MSNLRNRPFLVLSFTYTPAEGQNTRVKDFGKTAKWDPIENMVIIDRMTNKHLDRAELVIDLLEMKVIKCRDNSLNREDLMKVVVARYADDIKRSLANWIAKNPDNLEKVREFTEKFKKDNKMDDLETNLKNELDKFISMPNSEETRNVIIDSLIQVILDHNINDFSVVCDRTNNTDEQILHGELKATVSVRKEGDEEFTHYELKIGAVDARNSH